MASETIVAVFSTLGEAERAIGDLVEAGVPSTSIKHYARDDATTSDAIGESATETHQHHGFWAWLTGQENSTDHHDVYDRSIQSGRTVVTVVAEARIADEVHAILERHHPVELDDQESTHGAAGSGLAGGQVGSAMPASRTAPGMMASGTTGVGYEDTAGAPYAEAGGPAAARPGFEPRVATARDDTRTGDTEEVIPLAEETLEVGKREVGRGSTRIRRYTVERPVEEQIRLRDETVSVSRRPVTGATDIGADAFRDREITVTESREEAVVGKTSRVVEEVVVQKGVREHTETIKDSVRREEVEIDGPEGRAVDTDRTPGRPL